MVRPRDTRYANPSLEFRRLAARGVVSKLATGYYLVPPDQARARGDWRPPVEAVALGIAAADYDVHGVAVMGISAARLHGAVPRALAVAVVAVPKQRPPLDTRRGRVQFVRRRASSLDRVRVRTDVVQGWATSPEQTVIDLADRPELGDVTPLTASEAIANLAPRCDWDLLADLAIRQRKSGALARASWIGKAVVDVPFPRRLPATTVPAKGLAPPVPVDPEPFRVAP